MAKVWVKAKTIINTEEFGKPKRYFPGQWLQLGKHDARKYLSMTPPQIEILKPAVLQSVQDLSDCAIFFKGEIVAHRINMLVALFPGTPVQQWEGTYPSCGRFLLWNTAANLDTSHILTGFKLLEKWQLAVPLFDYDVLAERIGTTQEQAETKAIIHDLRVPVYDSRVLFVRQCEETRKLFEMWQEGSQLKFLQALYQTRPVVNALPPSWVLK